VTAADGHVLEVDFGLDWREHDPVQLDLGPVLALPDADANKVGALYSRAEVRDYLDVDSIRQAGCSVTRSCSSSRPITMPDSTGRCSQPSCPEWLTSWRSQT
jgi:hypothetical protein